MESAEELIAKLSELTETGTRDELLAKGLARGMIWEEGQLPADSPRFPVNLTNELLNHGYSVLGCAIRLRTLDAEASILDEGFRTAAESIEAAVRRGVRNEERGFHLMVAAAAFHLGHYAARSFSLLAEERDNLNLSSVELLLVALMQRRLGELEGLCLNWLSDDANTDAGVALLLEAEGNEFMPADAARVLVDRVFHRAVAVFDFGLRTGDRGFVITAVEQLDACVAAAERMGHVPILFGTRFDSVFVSVSPRLSLPGCPRFACSAVW